MNKHSDDTEFNEISKLITLKKEHIKKNNERLHAVRCYYYNYTVIF